MSSFKSDSIIKLNLNSDMVENSFNKNDNIYKIPSSKCGELFYSYTGQQFELHCSFCGNHFHKIRQFAKHILREHLFCNQEHSIAYLIKDDMEFDLKGKFNMNGPQEEQLTCEVNVSTILENNENSDDSASESSNTESNDDDDDDDDNETINSANTEKPSKIQEKHSKRRNVEKRADPYKCSICNSKFIRKYNLTQHILHKHNIQLSSDGASTHEEQISNKPENKKKQTPNKTLKKIICYICGKEASKSDMHQHLKSHDNTRYTHKCENCGKLFISEKSLELHNRNYHTKDKPFVCKFENCNKNFVSEHALTAHHRLHNNDRPFKCSICQKGFLYKYKMELHIKIYHVNGRSFKCDICGKSYYEMYTLERHKICHSGEKPFACDECPARFPRERSLAWHKQSHTGIKEYKCKICGKEYTLYNGIYSHMKTHGIKYSLAYEKGLVEPEKLKTIEDSDN